MSSYALFLEVMPFSVALDSHSRILAFGRSVKKLIPAMEVGDPVGAYFTLVRPRNGLLNYSFLSNLGETGVVLHAQHGPTFQMQAVPLQEEGALLLAGTIRLSSVNDFEASQLTLRDFPCWERTIDYLFTLREMEKEADARRDANDLAQEQAAIARAEAQAARSAELEAQELSRFLGSVACVLQAEIERPEPQLFLRRLLRLTADHIPAVDTLAFLPIGDTADLLSGLQMIPPPTRSYSNSNEQYVCVALHSLPAIKSLFVGNEHAGLDWNVLVRKLLHDLSAYAVVHSSPLMNGDLPVGLLVIGTSSVLNDNALRILQSINSALSTVIARAGLRMENQRIISRDRQFLKDLELVMRAARVLKWSWNINTGEVISDDEAMMLEIWGGTPIRRATEVIERILPQERLRIISKLDATVGNGDVFDEEFQVALDDRSVRIFRCIAVHDPLSPPEFPRVIGVTFDITERLSVAERLQETELYYRKLFEMMPDGIALCHFDSAIGGYRLSHINMALRRIFGLPLTSDFSDQRVTEVFPPSVLREMEEAVRDKANLLNPALAVVEMPALGDTTRFVRIEVTQVSRDEKHRVMFVRGFDIDAELREEQQRALLADLQNRANIELRRTATLKDEFLASMSHELRTPLNGILGACEILLAGACGDLDERQSEVISMCEGAGRHLLSIISDILDVSKIESGKMELNWQPVSFASLCAYLQRVMEPVAASRGITLEFSGDALSGEEILLDQTRFNQALINLLGNAIKFSQEGQTVVLRVEQDRHHGCVHFEVIDKGIGIALESQVSLFRPFEQASIGLARAHEGTGLGLTLVERIVQLHHGHIQVASAPGKGSSFRVTVPHLSQPAELEDFHVGTLATRSGLPPLPVGGVNVLVIDSQLSRAGRLMSQLSARGLPAVWFEDTLDAMKELTCLKPSIVFVEIGKTPNRALMLIEAIRAASGGAVKVVGLSALLVDAKECPLSKIFGLKYEIDGVMAEPWSSHEFDTWLKAV